MAQKLFTVFADWETSERAGAGGTFQVSSIEDEDGNDRSDLVDQGVHYGSAEAVARDIAEALAISAEDVSVEVE